MFAISSKAKDLPLVLLEAMALDKAIIAFKAGSVSEVIRINIIIVFLQKLNIV